MNLSEIANVLNSFYLLLVALGTMLMVYWFIEAIRRFVWASEFGGMNSMGTRNFSSEGIAFLMASMVAGNFAWFITAITGDLYGAEQFTWVEVKETDDHLKYIGDVIVALFTIIGFSVAYKTAGIIKSGNGQGEVPVGKVIINFAIAILCTQVRWLSTTIGEFTPFNPLGLFFSQSLINI